MLFLVSLCQIVSAIHPRLSCWQRSSPEKIETFFIQHDLQIPAMREGGGRRNVEEAGGGEGVIALSSGAFNTQICSNNAVSLFKWDNVVFKKTICFLF